MKNKLVLVQSVWVQNANKYEQQQQLTNRDKCVRVWYKSTIGVARIEAALEA